MGLSIFEKISVIFEMIIHNPFLFFFCLFTVMMATSLLVNLYVKKKYVKILFPIFYLLFMILLIVQFHTQLLKGIQLFIDDMFFQIYFPSIALYIFLLAINFVALVVSLCLKKITQYSKIVNIISFTVLQLLFSLCLFTIKEQKLVLSDWATLYQNTNILAILEVSISVFIGWIVLLIIGFGFHMINKHSDKKEEGIVISYDSWTQLDYLVKENILKLSEEVAELQKQLKTEREETKKELMALEQKLNQSNQFFIQKLKSTTAKIENSTLLTHVQKLQDFVQQNQLSFKKQVEQLQTSDADISEYVRKKVHLFETMIDKNNIHFERQIQMIQETPAQKIETMQKQVQALETLMKRYMTEMNYQIVQTRREMMMLKK